MHKYGKAIRIATYAICGILCALPAIFNNLWILGWVAYSPVIIIEYMRKEDEDRAYRKAWLRGFPFFYAYGLTIFFWIWELYPMDFAGFTPLQALGVINLAWFGVPLFQSLLLSFNTVWLTFLKKKNVTLWIWPILVSCLWVIQEWIQTLTWTGVPWGRLAIGQAGVLYNIQSASLLGTYFISFIMIAFSGYIAIGAINFIKNKSMQKGVLAMAVAVSLFFSNFVYGAIVINTTNKNIETIRVAAIQANIETADKWSNNPQAALDAHKELVLQASKEDVDLIVLAETAIPYAVVNDEYLQPYVEQMAKDADADILLGCYHIDQKTSKIYNATIYITPEDGIVENVYEKQRLVPFGEYVPMRSFFTTILPFLTEINMLSEDVSPGSDSDIFNTSVGNVGSLICFDAIYEKLAWQSARDGAEFFAVSTNDCWFQDSAAVYQHNVHARLRCIENGRYMVRSANTGISSIITDKGEVITMLPPLEKGYVIGEIELSTQRTLYSYIGNVLVLIAALTIAATIPVCIVKSKKKTQSA
jgi:apolipoprotein N-acyltransferase